MLNNTNIDTVNALNGNVIGRFSDSLRQIVERIAVRPCSKAVPGGLTVEAGCDDRYARSLGMTSVVVRADLTRRYPARDVGEQFDSARQYMDY